MSTGANGTASAFAQDRSFDAEQFKASVKEAAAIDKAMEGKGTDRLRAFLDRGLDPNKDLVIIGTPLFHAVSLKNLPAVELLVKRGGNLNAIDAITGWTPLFAAASIVDVAYLEKLIGLGADIRARTRDGESLFLRAAYEANADLMEYLLAKQSDPNEKAAVTGMTAAHMAVLVNCAKCVRVLKAHNARMNIKDARGETIASLCDRLKNDACKAAL